MAVWKLSFVTADDAAAAEAALEHFGATVWSVERTENRPDAQCLRFIYDKPDLSGLALPADARRS